MKTKESRDRATARKAWVRALENTAQIEKFRRYITGHD